MEKYPDRELNDPDWDISHSGVGAPLYIDVYTCYAASCAISTHLINPISSYGDFKYLKMLRLVDIIFLFELTAVSCC